MNPSWSITVWGAWLGLPALAALLYWRHAQRQRWPAWRRAVFLAGCALTGAAGLGLHDPLTTMSGYTVALMALGQGVSPLLLLGFPASVRAGWRRHRWVRDWLLDPWVAGAVFVALTLGVNLPGVFDTALAEALYAAPIGLLLLASGLMFWAQLLPGSSGVRARWAAGLYGWLLGLPMMVIAAVWVWSGQVLYTPYLDVLCVWNLSPLADQHYAGLVMFAAGLPLQLRAAWLLIMPAPQPLPACDPAPGTPAAAASPAASLRPSR